MYTASKIWMKLALPNVQKHGKVVATKGANVDLRDECDWLVPATDVDISLKENG